MSSLARDTAPSRRLLFYCVLAVLVAIPVEIGSYVGGRLLSRKGVLYLPHARDDYDQYLATRHPILGWPSPADFGQGDYDETGSRRVPSFPDHSSSCVSLYGDSFTWSDEVGSEHAWGNVLSGLLGCRVANYGVNGYGTDQAYLRFKHNAQDQAEVVVLGHMTEDIRRNVAQFRALQTGGRSLSLKPRFIVNRAGELVLIDLPTLSKREYLEMIHRPEAYLEHEYFIPDGSSGLKKLAFPFTWAVLRSLDHPRLLGKFTKKPWWADFYSPEHPSRGLDVTAGILERFHLDAVEAGRIPIVVIFPSWLDLAFERRTSTWAYQSLVERLASSQIEVLDVGPKMNAWVGDRDLCEISNDCAGHYSEEAYEFVAETVYEHLGRKGLFPRAQRDPSQAPAE